MWHIVGSQAELSELRQQGGIWLEGLRKLWDLADDSPQMSNLH
jgi:hypothetical protein